MAMVKREAMLIAQVERYCWSMRPGVLAGCAASTVTQNSFPWQQTAGCCCFRPSSEWLKHFHGHNRWTVNNKMWRWTFEYSRRDLKASLFRRYSGLICNVNISVRCGEKCEHYTSSLDPSWSEIPVILRRRIRVVSNLSVGKHQRSVNISPPTHSSYNYLE